MKCKSTIHGQDCLNRIVIRSLPLESIDLSLGLNVITILVTCFWTEKFTSLNLNFLIFEGEGILIIASIVCVSDYLCITPPTPYNPRILHVFPSICREFWRWKMKYSSGIELSKLTLAEQWSNSKQSDSRDQMCNQCITFYVGLL